jgi:hypothetical protein
VFNEDNPDEIFGERYTYAQVEWIIYSVVAFLTFAGDQEVFGCLLANDGNLGDCIGEITATATGFLTSSETANNLAENNNLFLAGFTTRPVSGIAYFKDIAERAKLVPEVSAQGFGFSAANPVLGLWRMVRNVTYFLLILVIIVMSFMIMFRVKISPQTVITVQSALPKIIVALLLITFSYAIAGLLIDLMYVVIGLIAGIISGSGLVGRTVVRDYGEWINMYNALTTERSIFGLLAQYQFTFAIGLISAFFASGFLSSPFGFLSLILIPLILLITAIVLLFAWLKILWLLFKTFAMILLQIVAGPIMILLGAFGVGGGFGLWLRSLIAQLAVYPVIGFMFIMSFVFLRGAFLAWEGPLGTPLMNLLFPFGTQQTLGGSTWTPPLTVGSTQTELLWLVMSLAVLLLIPNVSNIIRGMIERRPFQYGTAIGAALGAGAGVATWPVTQVAGMTQEAVRKGTIEVMQAPIRDFYERVRTGKR